MTNPPERKILLEIEGRMISVPTTSPRLYFAATFKPEQPAFPHCVHVTPDPEFAWTFLANSLVRGGSGHVVAYDITQAETEPPVRLECLGRFSFENRHEIPGQPETKEEEST